MPAIFLACKYSREAGMFCAQVFANVSCEAHLMSPAWPGERENMGKNISEKKRDMTKPNYCQKKKEYVSQCFK